MLITTGLRFHNDKCLSKETCVSISRHRARWHLSRYPVTLIEEVKERVGEAISEGISGAVPAGVAPTGAGAQVGPSTFGPWLSSQDRDLEPLRPGAPIFQMFNGEDVLYKGASTVYPMFINEAAYYEKGIAFFQTEKLTFSVPALPALAPAPGPAP